MSLLLFVGAPTEGEVTGIGLGPVTLEFAVPSMSIGYPQERTLGPQRIEYTAPQVFTGHETIGPAVIDLTVVNFATQARALGPVLVEFLIARRALLGDYDQFRTLGPTVIELLAGGVNKFQPPSRKILGIVRQPRIYVHEGWWPRQRIAVLKSAVGDYSLVGMQSLQTGRQAGEASFKVSLNDAQIGAVVEGRYLVVESTGLPTWAGTILSTEQDPRTATLDITAISIEAQLDGRITDQSFEIKQSIGSNGLFDATLNQVNAANHTGILPSLLSEVSPPIEQIQIGAQSLMEEFNEITGRTGYEWWVEVSASPRWLRFSARMGYRQGFDLSGSLHVYQGVHCSAFYKRDMSQVKQVTVSVSGFGTPLRDRNSVARVAGIDAPGVDFGAVSIDQASVVASRALQSKPAGLRNETLKFETMTDSTGELARFAQRAQEKPLASGEMFNIDFNSLADWSKLGVGNYFTFHGSYKNEPLVRVARIVGLQPKQDAGICTAVCEVPF